MEKIALLLGLVGACGRVGFEPGAGGGDAQPGGGDARPGGGAGVGCSPATDLVACWDFDGNTADVSGNGNMLTATAVAYGQGQVGDAVYVDATSDLSVADNATLTPATGITLEAWMRPTTLPGTGRAGLLDKSSELGMWLYSDQTFRCSFAIIGFGSVEMPANATVVAGEWHHVACVFDGSAITVFFDAALAGTVGAVGTLSNSNSPLVLGHAEPSGDPFTGALDVVRVWRRARTGPELCAGTGLQC